MSGESLWLMTVRARSGSSVVAMLSGASSRVPAIIHGLELLEIRSAPAGLDRAPLPVNDWRPVIVRRMAELYIYTDHP